MLIVIKISKRYSVPKGSKPNRYRTVFSDKDAMLRPKEYDISTQRDDRVHNPDPDDEETKKKKKKKKKKKEEKGEKKEKEPGKEKEKKKKKKSKREGKAKYTKSSQPPRLIKPATELDRELKRKHPTVALTIGTIGKRMKLNGIPDNDVAVIQQRIQSCIIMLNEVRQRVF